MSRVLELLSEESLKGVLIGSACNVCGQLKSCRRRRCCCQGLK